MANSILDSIRTKTLKEPRNNIKNYRMLLEPFRYEIWNAFLAGCNRTQIYKELIDRNEFTGSIEAFRCIFNNMFPDADNLRELNNIKLIKESTGLEESEITKKINNLKRNKKINEKNLEKKIINQEKLKSNNTNTKKKETKNKNKNNNLSDQNETNNEKQKQICHDNNSNKNKRLENYDISNMSEEEKKERFMKLVGDVKNDKIETKEDEKEDKPWLRGYSLEPSEEPWDPEKSTHGFGPVVRHVAGK